MKRHILLSVFTIVLFFGLHAQDNPKYLAGAVPEVDGKVVFSKTIEPRNPVSDDILFDLIKGWAEKEYDNKSNPKNRILLSDSDTKELACRGEAVLTFKKSSLVLDQSIMYYNLTLEIENGKCEASIRNIRYQYDFGREQSASAEDVITDEYAYNKKKNKLNRFYDKFRTHTVDTVGNIFRSLDVYLNGRRGYQGAIGAVEATQTVTPPSIAIPVEQSSTTSHSSLPGFRNIAPDKIPGNIMKLLSDWTLITSGTKDKTNVMTASWGGLGTFWGKPVSFCFLNPTRYSVETMDKGETYTISFYTEAYKDALSYCGSTSGRNTDKIKGSGLTPITLPSGATAFSEAWMIFECKKILAQQLSPEAVLEKNLPEDWTKNGYHKMYIGEIINVWVK